MSFLGRWLSDALQLAAALAGAIILLQAPAFTREYTAALLQVAEDSGRDIEQRKVSARQHYGIPIEADDPAFLAALRPHEPSNAETLTLSMERHRILRGAYEQITARSPLLQPVAAAVDATLRDERGYKAAVLRTLAQTYAVQVNFGSSSVIYGLAGLFAGSLLGHFIVTAGRGMRGRIRRRRSDYSTEPHPRIEPQGLAPWTVHPDGPEDGRPISRARTLQQPERSSLDRTSS
jgi:DUF2937 family protein